MDSITVNKSSTSFKYPIHISTNGWSQNNVLYITIIDPNGGSSSGMYGFSGNTFYLDITPSIIGKYSVSVKISSYGSVSSSNNPTGYITVVDPNANTNTPTNSNTPTNTNTNINNDNYIQEYYEDEYYDDYEYEVYLKAPTTKVKHKSNSYFKIKLLNFYDDTVKYKKITLKVWTGKKTKTYTLKTNSKGILLWRLSSWNNFAINILSLPPEIQTAILSPDCTKSYSQIARQNFAKIVL